MSLWPLPTDLDCVGEGGRAGVAVPGDGASSSSGAVMDTGEVTELSVEIRLILELPDLTEAESDRSLPAPSRLAKAEAEARGLGASSPVLLIFFRIEVLNDLLSCVSVFEIEGYCCKLSGTKLFDETDFLGVEVPSPLLDCCWPIIGQVPS